MLKDKFKNRAALQNNGKQLPNPIIKPFITPILKKAFSPLEIEYLLSSDSVQEIYLEDLMSNLKNEIGTDEKYTNKIVFIRSDNYCVNRAGNSTINEVKFALLENGNKSQGQISFFQEGGKIKILYNVKVGLDGAQLIIRTDDSEYKIHIKPENVGQKKTITEPIKSILEIKEVEALQ